MLNYNTVKLNILYSCFFVAHRRTLKERKKFLRLIVLTIVSNNITIKFNIFDKIIFEQLVVIN